jgi:hypothetical protein
MNRLAPLIVRRVGPHARVEELAPALDQGWDEASAIDDLKMFFLAWLGGFVFFGTYFS